jgi:hypothetical protein
MNIRQIKAEVFELVRERGVSVDQVSSVMDVLADKMFEEGKIADIILVHGKRRSKRLTKGKRSKR